MDEVRNEDGFLSNSEICQNQFRTEEFKHAAQASESKLWKIRTVTHLLALRAGIETTCDLVPDGPSAISW
ncbi:MAG TPA: hypothetical protein EYG03_21620 [Planctomycetes bacterium]|nr:hypothetical protein [Fuerstiella sp.]HIK94553.1 hypothetical protein [Planctomycetota bacterium]